MVRFLEKNRERIRQLDQKNTFYTSQKKKFFFYSRLLVLLKTLETFFLMVKTGIKTLNGSQAILKSILKSQKTSFILIPTQFLNYLKCLAQNLKPKF